MFPPFVQLEDIVVTEQLAVVKFLEDHFLSSVKNGSEVVWSVVFSAVPLLLALLEE